MSTKPTSQSAVVKMALLGILGIGFYYLHDGMQYVSLRINELPVQGQAQEAAAPVVAQDANASTMLVKNLHPLLVESNNKAQALHREASAGPANLDALFGREQAQEELDAKVKKDLDLKKAAEKAAAAAALPASAQSAMTVMAMPVIDSFKLLAAKVRVQAVMADGAVVNGGFYEIGTEVKTLGYPSADGQKTVYPKLFSIEDEVVLFSEAGSGVRKIRAKLLH